MKIGELEVILKVAERCNLDCEYCYFFHGGNERFRDHPPIISEETIRSAVRYINNAVSLYSVRRLRISLHGGEPLLLGKMRFSKVCATLRDEIKFPDLEIAVQTNGTLIDSGWVEVFRRHKIFVGVSLDGPKDINDSRRVDRRGRGSYDRVRRAIDLMTERTTAIGMSYPVGALCVVQSAASGRDVYRHFVDDLGLTNMDFLLPDETHDSYRRTEEDGYSSYLRGVYDEWSSDNNRSVSVRFIDRAVARLTTDRPMAGAVQGAEIGLLILKIASNGDVDPTDLVNSGPGPFLGKYNCRTSELADFLADVDVRPVVDAHLVVPRDCEDCCWRRVCGGGEVHNRYSSEAGINNRSVFCNVYKELFSHISAHLMASGTVDRSRILRSLAISG